MFKPLQSKYPIQGAYIGQKNKRQAKGLGFMNQALKDSHVDNKYKYMPKICQRYARSNSEATNSRQLPKEKICQRYAKDNYLKQ